jgi:hypothetical protein
MRFCTRKWLGGESSLGVSPGYLGYHGYLENPRVIDPHNTSKLRGESSTIRAIAWVISVITLSSNQIGERHSAHSKLFWPQRTLTLLEPLVKVARIVTFFGHFLTCLLCTNYTAFFLIMFYVKGRYVMIAVFELYNDKRFQNLSFSGCYPESAFCFLFVVQRSCILLCFQIIYLFPYFGYINWYFRIELWRV